MNLSAQLIAFFAGLSLLAFGGAPATLPELERAVVERHHWMSLADFNQLFVISQAAPGPNILIVALIGWQLTGVAGAVLSLAAFCLPCGVLAFLVGTAWSRFAESPWRKRLAITFASLAVGMVTASGVVVAQGVDASWRLVAISALAALVVWRTKLNPLVPLGLAALLGALQIV